MKKGLNMVKECQPGNYIFHPKFIPTHAPENWSVFGIAKNKSFTLEAKLVLETPTTEVYLKK